MEVEVGKDSPPGPKRPCMKDKLRRFRPSHPHKWGDTWTDDEWQEPEDRSRIRKVAKPFEFPKPDPPSTVKNPFESTRIHKWIFEKLPHRTWNHIHPIEKRRCHSNNKNNKNKSDSVLVKRTQTVNSGIVR